MWIAVRTFSLLGDKKLIHSWQTNHSQMINQANYVIKSCEIYHFRMKFALNSQRERSEQKFIKSE